MAASTWIAALLAVASLQATAATPPDDACVGTYRLQDGRDVDLARSGDDGYRWRMKDGTIRDTCVYSIIAPEWPTVRSHLTWLLEKPR